VSNKQKAQKSFLAQPMVLLRDVGQVETRFDRFGDTNLGARWVCGLRRMYRGHGN